VGALQLPSKKMGWEKHRNSLNLKAKEHKETPWHKVVTHQHSHLTLGAAVRVGFRPPRCQVQGVKMRRRVHWGWTNQV